MNEQNEKNFFRLVDGIESTQGQMEIFVVRCDNLALRQAIVDRYEAELQPDMAAFQVWLDRDEPSLTSALHQLVEGEKGLQEKQPAVITILGAEELSFVGTKAEKSPQEKFFGYLQWTREALRQFPFALVLWINSDLHHKLPFRASDFWSWRKQLITFEPETELEPQPVPEPEYRSTWDREEDDTLSLDALKERIANLEKTGSDPAYLSTLYVRLGEMYRERLQRAKSEDAPTELQEAFRSFDEAIKIQTRLGLKSALVYTFSHRGLLHNDRANYYKAISSHEKSLKFAREVGDRKEEAAALGNSGLAYRCLGEYRTAIDFHQRCIDIVREIGYRRGEAIALGNSGLAYRCLGEYRTAIDFHQRCIDIVREIGYRRGEAIALGNLGIAYYSLGEYRTAINFHQRHLAISREIGYRRGEAVALGNLGLIYRCLGKYRTAIDFHQHSLDINREIEDRKGEASSLNNLGSAYYSLGKYHGAIDFYQASLAISQEIGTRLENAGIWFNLGYACIRVDRAWEALEAYQNALQLYQELELDKEVEECEAAIRDIN